jgi:hypothetical protein
VEISTVKHAATIFFSKLIANGFHFSTGNLSSNQWRIFFMLLFSVDFLGGDHASVVTSVLLFSELTFLLVSTNVYNLRREQSKNVSGIALVDDCPSQASLRPRV